MSNLPISDIIQFIRAQYPQQDQIYLHEPRFFGNEKQYLLETIDSTFVSSVGPFVERFEQMMAAITHTKRGVAVVNGTAALQVALQLLGVQRDTEVITQALSFVATSNAIAYLGAVPGYADVDLDTMGLSPQALAAFLEAYAEPRETGVYNKKSGRKIAAILPMHTFGHPCRIDELVAIAEKYKIPVVEDAAESLGSYYKNQATGSFGQLGTFSFNGNKTVTCGGGGAIVSQSEALGKTAKHLTTTAKVPHAWEYYHDQLGYNYRMPNLNAALACAQLEQLDAFIKNKRELAGLYQAYFNTKGIKFKTEPADSRANYWLMAIELDNRRERDAFLEATNQQGVYTRPVWTLLHKLPMYATCQHDGLPNSQYLEDRIVNLPSSVRA
ncbi:MAG: LegC family aminotransferase [Saprospiraceae bacterium]